MHSLGQVIDTVAPGTSRLRIEVALTSAFCCWLGVAPAGVAGIALPSARAAARIQAGEVVYSCPMHPDQRSPVPGTCPICRMPLAAMPAVAFDTYPVDLRVTPTTTGARLRLTVHDPRNQAAVRRFTIVHERPMHLFVVGGGLAFFAYEHPEQQPDGVFMIDVPLPRRGPYMAIAEFLPEGGTPQSFQQMFTTGEAFSPMAVPPVDVAAKLVDGVRVSVDASKVQAGGRHPLVVRVDDPSSGAPVVDLEPYLGAAAHVLLVATDLTEAIHEHGDSLIGEPGVTFQVLVPRPGRYKMWVQFQRGGRVSTAAFVIEVS
jgi:hypothetical protein